MVTDASHNVHSTVRTLLRDMRMEAGLRQADLAVRLGQTQSFVSKYETGDRELGLTEVRTICLALGTSLSVFVSRLEEMIVEGR